MHWSYFVFIRVILPNIRDDKSAVRQEANSKKLPSQTAAANSKSLSNNQLYHFYSFNTA